MIAREITKIYIYMDNLIDLRIIMEEIGKINNNEKLKIEKIKGITRKALKVFKTEQTEELERKLRFLAVKNRSFRNLSEEEKKQWK